MLGWILLMTALSFSCDVSQSGVTETVGQFAHTTAGKPSAYDALDNAGNRRPAPITIVREDVHLRGGKHTRLQANANDVNRNFAMAAWAVRRHLDYVSRFEFQATTKDEGLNRDLKTLMEIQSKPLEFDAGQRFGREKFFRLAEARRLLDGDTGILLINNGTVQGIEADLIKQPPAEKIDPNSSHEWVDGVEVDGAGAVRRYSIYGRQRGGVGYVYRKNVAAANLIHHGFFSRYASEQTRGIGPIVSALNHYRDLYENFNYALARMKLSQLFAMAVYRKPESGSLKDEFPDPDSSDAGCPNNAGAPSETEIDLQSQTYVFDLDTDEKAEFLESAQPSDQFRAYTILVSMLALKALDIPYSFYDESFTNYSGQRTSWLLYERACVDPRDDQLEMRRRWTLFQLRRWIGTGLLKLPGKMTIGDLSWAWTPLGMPWWKPSEELVADLKSIAAGLSSPQRVCQERNMGDPRENLRQTAEFLKYAREIGMEVLGEPLRPSFDGGPFPAELVSTETPPNKGAA